MITHDALRKILIESHKAAVKGGWWSDLITGEKLERNKGELLCLVHSEVSEAYAAWDSDEMDDKLPHRRGDEVELGDTLIRLGDYIVGFDHDVDEIVWAATDMMHAAENAIQFNESAWPSLHVLISDVMEKERKGKDAIYSIAAVIACIIHLGHSLNLNVEDAVWEKLAYNASRADHKPENRRVAGGKKF